MADAFETILGQPQVRDYLRASVKSEHVTHAYLFIGPAGSNKTATAYALARAILCPKGPKGPRGGICGACEHCSRISRRVHPDVHFYEPEGSNGYLIEQIRDIVSNVSFAPIQADKKIYILDRVDLLGVGPANAFLKTLEEPPENTIFILLGRTRDSVLPTIASRCQIVPFRHIPPSEAAGIVSQNTGAPIERSRQAIEATGGSLSKAIAFLSASGNERLAFRSSLFRMLSTIDEADDWHIMLLARKLVEMSKAPLDVVRVKQEEELSANSDFLEKSAIRQIEARNKRQLSAKSKEYLRQTFDLTISWLRDVLAVKVGTPELVINDDFFPEISAASAIADESRLASALNAIYRYAEGLTYNISPETCMDLMLLEVRGVFNGTNCPC